MLSKSRFSLLLLLGLLVSQTGLFGFGTIQLRQGNANVREGQTLQPGSEVKSHLKSQVEAHLENSGTLKLGSSTEVFIRDQGEHLDLKQGVVKLRSDESGFFRKTMKLQTSETEVKTKGTALIAYLPGKYMKITCIEGSVTVSLKAVLRESVTLRPGQMLILHPQDRRIPDLVEIHLETLVATSALLKPNSRFQKAIGTQNRFVKKQAKLPSLRVLARQHGHHDHAANIRKEVLEKQPEEVCLDIQKIQNCQNFDGLNQDIAEQLRDKIKEGSPDWKHAKENSGSLTQDQIKCKKPSL